MYLLLIAGIIGILLGCLLIVTGIRQGVQRVEHEGTFLPAEAKVVDLERRAKIVTVHHVIPVGFVWEYRVWVKFSTPQGQDVESSLPYALGISPEVRAAKRSRKHGEPMEILYDPADPETCHYGSKTVFHIREVLYKFIAAGILIALGAWLVWWQYHI